MQQQASKSLRWICQQMRPHRGPLILAALLTLLTCAMGLVPLWAIYAVSQILFDSASTQPLWQQPQLYSLGLFALLATLLRYPFIALAYVLTHKAAYATLYQMRRDLLDKLTRIQMGFFSNKSQGQLKKILSEDVERIELFIAHHLPDLLTAIVTPLQGFVLLCWVDWRLALISLTPLPLALLLQRRLFSDFEQDFQQWHQGLERLNASMLQFIKGMQVIRAFNLSASKGTQLQQHIDDHHLTVRNWTRRASLGVTSLKLSMETGLLFLLPIGVLLTLNGTIDLPVMLLFLLIGSALFEPFNNLLLFGGMLSRILQGVERIQEIHRQPDLSVLDRPDIEPQACPTPDNGFVVENLTFKHSGQNQPAINNISCSFKPGQLTAIVGPSGSGKSTLAKLLLRFFDPQQGRIWLDQRPLSSYSNSTLSQKVAMVFQEQYLLNDSLHNNIAMGQPHSKAAVTDAAHAAQADQFIRSLPQGYDTLTGDTGEPFSGGEQQRLNIARAMLKDAPVVILDEATAFTDAGNEAQIQQGLNRLLKHKTVIVIAHRLSSIRHADQILVLDQGELLAQGNHQQLLDQCPLYQNLWHRQQRSQGWSLAEQSAPEPGALQTIRNNPKNPIKSPLC